MDIEDLHRVVVQGFASLNDKIDSGLASVNDKIDSGLTSVNDKIDCGLASVSDRIDRVETRLTHIDTELGRVKDALMEHGRQLKDIRAALDREVDREELEARH